MSDANFVTRFSIEYIDDFQHCKKHVEVDDKYLNNAINYPSCPLRPQVEGRKFGAHYTVAKRLELGRSKMAGGVAS